MMQQPPKSSFVRKVTTNQGQQKRVGLPDGSRLSPQNGQWLISSGLPDLDEIFGGGLIMSTLMLVEEDIFSRYAVTLMKYFIAEGVVCHHDIFLAADENSKSFIENLPSLSSSSYTLSTPATQTTEDKNEPSLKIAWQYQKYLLDEKSTMVRSAAAIKQQSVWCHTFDLSRKMKTSDLRQCNITTFDVALPDENVQRTKMTTYRAEETTHSSPLEKKCKELYNALNRTINAHNRSMMTNGQSNVLRIGIQSFGSTLWGTDSNSTHNSPLLLFLHALKGLLRQTLAVCMITLPHHLFEPTFLKKIYHICDSVVTFEAFNDSMKEVGEAFRDHVGLFHIRKIPFRLNSLSGHLPEQLVYTFRMKRKKLWIEKIHLPPEISRTTGKLGEENEKTTTRRKEIEGLLCQPGPPTHNSLDF